MNRPPRSIQNDLAAKTRLGAIDLPNPPCGRRLMEVHQLRYRATETAATTPVRVARDQQLVEASRVREPSATQRLVQSDGDPPSRLAQGSQVKQPAAQAEAGEASPTEGRQI